MSGMEVRQEDSTLVTLCLDFCRQLALQGKDFSISLKLGSNFSFSLDTMKKINTTTLVTKKTQSPSSARRSARQRKNFMEQKGHSSSSKSVPAAKCNMETTNEKSNESTSKDTFKCDQRDSEFENEKRLKCHKRKKHKLTLSPIPQVDGHSEYAEVTIPLGRAMEDCLHLKYDKPPSSVIHPERGRGFYHDTDPRDGQFCYKFSDGKLYDY